MLTPIDKISYLESFLNEVQDNYADSFKTDIIIYFGDFKVSNQKFEFINTLNSKLEIENWVNKLTSRIVMKFESETDQMGDFIYDYLKYN